MAKKASKRPARTRAKRGSSKGPARRSAAARTSSPGKARARRAAKPAKPRRAAATRTKPVKKAAPRPNRASRTSRSVTRSKPAAKTPTTVRAAKQAPAAAPAKPVHRLSLDRNRRHLPEIEDNIPTPPSSLDLDRTPSAARSGRKEMHEARLQHNETSPVLTGGDVDADWEDAYAVGDEAPGGDNPTPDQDRVDDIGKALGVEYQDNEELRASDKITERDKHRWELDPASSEDYPDRD
jgi:hypothetical protein